MLRDLFTTEGIIRILLRIPVLLIALTVHESAHALVSYKLGDPTARAMGRVSLNPLKHLDIFGSICMILFGIGWAKPVIINPDNFKHRKLGEILTSVAGPLSNLILGFIGAIAYTVYSLYGDTTGTFGYALLLFFQIFMMLNVSLAVFNMIPIPPLDGSHLVTVFLPKKAQFYMARYSMYISIAFIALIYAGAFSGILSTAIGWICNGMIDLILTVMGF